MTKEQIEILKALHLLKDYCVKTPCQYCMLAIHDDDSGDVNCLFDRENICIPADWDNLKEPKEEKIFTVFK